MSNSFGDAARGAAAGAMLGPLGALGGALLGVLPDAANWLFGDDPASKVAQSAAGAAVQALIGTSEPAAASAALERDPALGLQLWGQLAMITAQADRDHRVAELAELQARLGDVAGARAQTQTLAAAHSRLAWGAAVVSLVVLVTFGTVMALALFLAIPPGSEAVLNVLLGTLAAMATSVVSYWVGSSAGSARKESLLSNQRGGAV